MRRLTSFFGIVTIIAVFFLSLLVENAFAVVYYVSKSGNNTDGSTWSSAWIDINYIKGLTDGDTVYIASGEYTGTFTFTASGSSSTPITIKRATILEHGTDTGWSDGFDGTVTVTGKPGATIFTVSNRNNIVIDGVDRTKFILDGNSSANYGIFGNGSSTHSIIIKNMTIHHFRNTGINFGLSNGFSNNVEIANCELYKNGDGVSHETEGSIIFLYNYSIGQGRNKVHDNYIHDGCIKAQLAACDLMTGNINYTDIYNNHFNSGWTTTSSSDMMHINGDDNKIYNNTFETTGNNQNVFIHTNNPARAVPDNNFIYNNLFYKPSSDTGNGALSLMAYDGGTISNLFVYNNTFFGHRWNVYLNKSGSANYLNIVFKNNIFWPNSVQARHIFDNAGVFSKGQMTLDNNFYFTNLNTDKVLFSYTYLSLSQLQGQGYETNGGNGNPFFSSTANANGFYLTTKSPSPLIGGGADISNIFNDDKNGKIRIPGQWDLGPYNYSRKIVLPSPPSNLKLL